MLKSIFGYTAAILAIICLGTFATGIAPWVSVGLGVGALLCALISGFAWEAEQKELGNPV